jgi:predicted branched-subunit amino acid permease
VIVLAGAVGTCRAFEAVRRRRYPSAPMGLPANTASPRRPRFDRAAITDGIPLFVPAVPFGFVVGVAVVESEMPAAVGWSTSLTIFAGASQLATVTLAGVATVWAVVVAALVINSRHVMYSAALAPTFRNQPRWFRWTAPFFLIDQVFALVALRSDQPPPDFRRYYLSLAIFFYLAWIAAVTLGMAVGPVVPSSWRLDVAPAIMFTGMVVLTLDRAPAVIAASVAAGVGLGAATLPDRLGIIVGASAGVLAGAIAEERRERRAETAADPAADPGAGPTGEVSA